MPELLESVFLDFSIRKLRQLTEQVEVCLGKMNDQQIWARGSEDANSVGNLVLHLCGNVRQWITGGVGGRPNTRDRDAEFSARGGASAVELRTRLRAVVEEAVGVLTETPPSRLTERVVIQRFDLTVLEAIYHVVEHFALHAGQIMFAAKLSAGDLGFHRHLGAAASAPDRTP